MAFVHRQAAFDAGPENARGEVVGEGGDESFVGGGELDEAGEVGGDGVEGGDVGEAELAEGVLEDRDASGVGCFGCGGGVDGLDDFVDLGRNKGICKN